MIGAGGDMKNIVLLSDGTGNSAAKLFKTNVWRLYQALDLTDETQQIAYYDDGVGTSSFRPLALLGGAFGWGLKRNVIDLYAFLCRNYQPGDRIYCFGFSRGAFTIRILTGLVNSQGLVQADTEEALRERATEAFERYRNVGKHWRRKVHKARRGIARMRSKAEPGRMPVQAAPGAPDITFVGLWDTVAAYGLPIDELTQALSFFLPLSVPDRNPCPIVKRACHALALDDERKTFHPVLWNEHELPGKHVRNAAHIQQEIITQVWFAGVHSDVGGGYAEEQLSLTALDWMIGEAAASKLEFDREAGRRLKAAMNINGMLHDSRQGTGQAYRYLPRDIEKLVNDRRDPDNEVRIARPKIHESVFRRIANSDESYAPIVLPARYAVVDASGNIHDLHAARPAGDAAFVGETVDEARYRVARQRAVWDLVASRRRVYFASAIIALLLAAFPWLIVYAAPECSGVACWPGKIIRWVGGWFPDFLDRWFAAYASHPIEFAALALVLYWLLGRSALLRTRIIDRMRAIWMTPGVPRNRSLGDAPGAPLDETVPGPGGAAS
jgi:uncharacterized protein (DUF2235 family)